MNLAKKLSDSERTRFFECKNIIRENLLICFDVGEALIEIRDAKLYREEFDSFESFCSASYGVNRSRAYQLMQAVSVKAELTEEAAQHIKTESQARALSKIEPEKRSETVLKAATNGTVTAKSIKQAAKQIELDKTGFKIPEKLLPIWSRTTEVNALLTAVSRIRTALRNAQEEDDPLWRPVSKSQTWSKLLSNLDGAYSSIGLAIPYAVCPICQGHLVDQCTTCQQRGFVSEFFYKNCVDSQSKEIREKTAKKGT